MGYAKTPIITGLEVDMSSIFSHKGSPMQQHWIDEEILVGDLELCSHKGGF